MASRLPTPTNPILRRRNAKYLLAGVLAAAALCACTGSAAAVQGSPATSISITLPESAGETPDAGENSNSPSTGGRFSKRPLLLALTTSGLLLAALCKTRKQPQKS